MSLVRDAARDTGRHQPRPAAKPRILIVDDEAANRELLAQMVAHEGFEPLLAAGGAEALALLGRESVDLVLLDMMMPELGGGAVLAELKKRQALPSLPVIVVTAHDDRQLRLDALKAGAIDFLTKPVDRLEIGARIRTLIDLKRLREHALAVVEHELRESNHLLQQRFEQSPVAKIAWDTSFRVVAWNPAAEELFGHTAAEALGQHTAFIVPESARAQVDGVWRELLAGRAAPSTNENVTRDGRTIVCDWHNAALTSADGTVVGVFSVVLDITERMRLQRALIQSQKMDALGKLAGGVAHDFNNILAVILTCGGFLRDALPDSDVRRADILEVLKAADRGAGLTKQLLAFSQQQPTAKRPTDLNQSLAQLRDLLVTTVGEHIQLVVVPAAGPAVVRIDPVHFDQIVLNLAVNARDAMPGGGRLRIALELVSESSAGQTEEGWVRLTVTDTGTGMDEPTQHRIFEPFFSTKEKGKGTGLGLATCFGIVGDANGTIGVKSALGQGTTMTVELPRSMERPDSIQPEGQILTAGGGETLLVAEDDAALRQQLVRVLEGAGYIVHSASDGDEAMRKIDELGSRLDAVVTDAVMPTYSGYDVAEHVARVTPGAGVILISGYLDERTQRSQRVDLPFLWKPVRREDLVRAVAQVLSAKRSNRAAPVVPGSAGNVVLVVEDDEVTREAMVRVLAGAGYSPETAGTVAEARQALESRVEPRHLLCDLSLPDGSGAELLDWIQRTRPALCARVLVLTGGAIDDAGQRVVKSGMFRILSKPLPPRQLLEVLAGGRQFSRPFGIPLPGRSSPRSQPLFPRAHSMPPPKGRVLVVEDDKSLGRAMLRILNGDGFEVVHAPTLDRARHALAEGLFDVLVVDVGLPDGNGFDLLRELRGRNSEVPIVMTTGAPSVESAAEALRRRVSEYLPKPFPAEELLRIVQTAAEAGRVAQLRSKLLAARFGGDEFVGDIAGTEKIFANALSSVRMVFQPIVYSADSSVYGYEALLRCGEPALASPVRLLAAAEVLGRVNDVGHAVRAAVAATMRAHPTRLEAIFVNLHPTELRADILAQTTDPLLELADRVVLEVTERASLESGPKLDDELARIREPGFRLAVDDLGEGYAGLSSLVKIRPDIAKIDMSLVRDIHRAPLKRDIVAALVDMARRSDIIVVAEGVETVEERSVLVDLGCDLLQGYLFAKPGSAFPVPRTTFQA